MKNDFRFVPQTSEDVRETLAEINRELSGSAESGHAEPPAGSGLRSQRLPDMASRLSQALWDLGDARRIDPGAVIESRRPRIGPAIIGGQRIVRRLTGWYLTPILHRIQIFQDQVTTTLMTLVENENARHEHTQARLDAVTSLLHHERLLGRLDRLERLVQVLRLGGADLPNQPTLGTRDMIAREPDRFDYQAFEDRFRGSPEKVRGWQAPFISEFAGAPGPVLDLGCGRGEFLALLADAGIDGYGIDESPDLVASCRDAGLSAFRDDAITHLTGLANEHLGGIFASHVIEHLDNTDVWAVIRLAGEKIRPGGTIILESPNPYTVMVTATTFWLDPTHRRPIHPETLRFLLEQAGFGDIRLLFREPFPESDRLPTIGSGEPSESPLVTEINDRIERLNEILFGARDFICIARRTPASDRAE